MEADEASGVLAAEEVYVLMNNEHRVSRNARVQWFCKNLNQTIEVAQRRKLAEFREELEVVSVTPNAKNVPDDWDSDTSHLYTYRVLPSSTVIFLARKYRFVFCLDFSSSSSCVNLHDQEVLYAKAFFALRTCLDALVRPFFVPGSEFLFLPKIYVSVTAFLPFQTMTSEQVLIEGYAVSERNIGSMLTTLSDKLHKLVGEIAAETGVFVERRDRMKAAIERLTGTLFEENEGNDRSSPKERPCPRLSCPRGGVLNEILRQGLLALQLLPELSASHIVVITDGVNASPDSGLLDYMLTQLRTHSVTCSFIHLLGEPFQPQQGVGILAYPEILEFVAKATCGAYLNGAPALGVDYERDMNMYHRAFFTWSFQTKSEALRNMPRESIDMNRSFCIDDPTVPTYKSIENLNFTCSQDLQLVRRPCMPLGSQRRTMKVELSSILASRIREGFTVRDIVVSGEKATLTLVLPWKPYVTFEYVLIAPWPITDPTSPDGKKERCDLIVYELFMEGITAMAVAVGREGEEQYFPIVPFHDLDIDYSEVLRKQIPPSFFFFKPFTEYGFLRDITYGKRRVKLNLFRGKNVSRYWSRLSVFAQADQLLVHLHSFAANQAAATIPETMTKGLPLFAPGPPPAKVAVLPSDVRSPSFVTYWKPIAMMDPALWQRWMHTWRLCLIFEHDRPLPASKLMHQPNAQGNYEPAPCRQAAASLSTLLNEWSTFVLIEGSAYIKIIYDNPEASDKTAISFCLLKVSPRHPYVILRLAFLGGTPGAIRHKILAKLREKVLHLTFPLKPSATGPSGRQPPLRLAPSTLPPGVTPTIDRILLDGRDAYTSDPFGDVLSQTLERINEEKLSSPPTQRCCVEMSKPLEKILVRYERLPLDFFSPPGASDCSSRGRGSGSLKAVASLWQFLHHKRWVWAAQSSPGSQIPMAQIVQILATIREMRLEEGFHFAFFSRGVITMVREIQMKVMEAGDLCPAVSGTPDNSLPCTVQYVIFPPYMCRKDSRIMGDDCDPDGEYSESDDDEGEDESDDSDDEEAEGEGQLQLITECWIEPQIGTVVDPHPYHFSKLTYEKILDVVFKQDLECISTLITMAHLSLMCQNSSIPSPSGQLTPFDVSAKATGSPEIEYVPFCFDVTRLLPKCQQVELLFSTLIEDLATKLGGTPNGKPSAESLLNQHFFDFIFDELREIADREVTLNATDWSKFPELVRLRDRPWENSEPPFECPNSTKEEDLPKWRSFVKGISPTHLLFIILPATYEDLVKLMIRRPKLMERRGSHPQNARFNGKSVRLVVDGVDDIADASFSRTDSIGQSSSVTVLNGRAHPLSDAVELLGSSLPGRSYSLGHGPISRTEPSRVRAKSGSGILSRSSVKPIGETSENKLRCPGGTDLDVNEMVLNRSCEVNTTAESFRSSLDGVFLDSTSLLPESKKFWAGTTPSSVGACKGVKPSDSTDDSSPWRPTLAKRPSRRPKPIFGSVVLPIYVYDCPLSGMIGSLACSKHETKAKEKDEFYDHTYKFSSELHDGKQPLSRESSGTSRESGEDWAKEALRREVRLKKGLTRKDMCETIELCVLKSFVSSVFKCLQMRLPVHAQDVLAAVERCHDMPVELDLTEFLQIICHHVKQTKAKCAAENAAQETQNPVELPLSTLKALQPCECVRNLHVAIKQRFLDALQISFQVVPSHPQYFFYCPPGWGKRAEEASDHFDSNERSDLDSTLKSDTVIFQSELPGVGGVARDRCDSVGGDDRLTSLMSNVDSMSHMSEVDSGDDINSHCGDVPDTNLAAPPLFIHLMCAAKIGQNVHHLPVSSLPVCLADILPCLENFGQTVTLDNLQVRLDVLCLTLPPIVLTMLSKRGRAGLRSTSFCSGASTELLEGTEMPETDDKSDGSSVIENIEMGMKGEHPFGLLPAFQKQSIDDTVEEVKWLLKDEMVSSLLENETVDVSSLEAVCEHVEHSNGRASCIYQEVPLDFVCSPSVSHAKFIEKLKEFRVQAYNLRKAGNFYFISRAESSISRRELREKHFFGKRLCSHDLTKVEPPRQDASDDILLSLQSGAAIAGIHSCGSRRAMSAPQSPVKRLEQPWKRNRDTSCSDLPVVLNHEPMKGARTGAQLLYDVSKGLDENLTLDMLEDKYKLPGFWLILRVDKDRVMTFFHCRSGTEDIRKVAEWRKIHHEVIDQIRETCKVVNQILLLQDLHDTRLCRQLLEPEAPEDIWGKEGNSSGSDSESTSRRQYLKDRSPDDGDGEKPFLEASLRMKPGMFACGAVWKVRFYLHPRLKTAGVKTGAHRAVTVLQGVLSAFSVTNRRNMFVYQDRDDNVFYLRLHECPAAVESSPALGAPVAEETVDASGLDRLRSFSYNSTFPRRSGDHDMSYEVVADPSQVDQDAASLGSLLSGVRATDDFLVLVVHGVTEASPSIKVELVEMLRKRLDEAVLDIISIMLLRNPQCKLRPEDVRFIQSWHEAPADTLKLCVPAWSLPYLPAVHLYLKQNLMSFLFPPRYIDAKTENHFVDCWDDPYHERDGDHQDNDIFLYLINNAKPGAGAEGIACVSMVVTNTEGFKVVWNTATHTRFGRINFAPLMVSPSPSPSPSTGKTTWIHSDYEWIVNVREFHTPDKNRKTPGSDSSEPDAEDREVESFLCKVASNSMVTFRIWNKGKIDMDLLKAKLTLAVKQSLWDLYSEYKVFLAPPSSDEEPRVAQVETASAPATPVKFPRRSSCGGLSVSHPPDRTPSPLQPHQGSKSPLKSQLSLAEPPVSVCNRPPIERLQRRTPPGEPSARPPIELLENIFLPWLQYGVNTLFVPSVRKNSVQLASRQNVDIFIREFRCIIEGIDDELVFHVVERPKTDAVTLKMPKPRKVEPIRSATQTPSSVSRNDSPFSAEIQGFLPVSAQEARRAGDRESEVRSLKSPGGPSALQEVFMFGRRTRYWRHSQFSIPDQERQKGPVRFHSGAPMVSPAVTPTLPGQSVSAFHQMSGQSAGSQLGSTTNVFASPDSGKFVVTRQCLIYVTVRDKYVSIYTYNWSRDAQEQLMMHAQRLANWLNSRTKMLHSIVYQKMGLFHGQPLARAARREKDNKALHEIDALIKEPRFNRDGSFSSETTRHRHSSSSSHHEDLRPPRPTSGPGLMVEPLSAPSVNLPAFLTVYKDSRPRVPLHSTPYAEQTDIVTRHGRQLLDLRRADHSDSDKKLLVQSQTRDAHANIPLNMSLIQHLCSSMARPIHYVYTPLLFLPRWRSILASIRDHSAAAGPGEEEETNGNQAGTPPVTTTSTSNPALVGFPAPVGESQPPITKTRHNSGHTVSVSHEPRLSLTSTPRFGPMTSPLRGASVDETWHDSLILTYIQEYIQYLQSLGFIFVQAKTAPPKARKQDGKPAQPDPPPGPRIVLGGPTGDQVSVQVTGGNMLSLGKLPPQFLLKCCVGGILIIEVGISDPYAYAKIYALERTRLQLKSNPPLSRQNAQSFVDECDRIMFMHHMHSFTYDYHLRALHAYLSGRKLLFRHGYHLTACLDDFIKYYTKGPNFARNLIHAGSMVIENTYTPGVQLYNYLMNHCEKIYDMRVVRMSPTYLGASGSPEADSEYVLIKLSTHVATYKDSNEAQQIGEFDLTVVIALENENWDNRLNTENFLALKFYVILTNKKDLYPKLAPARVGKFRTVCLPAAKPPGKAFSLSGLSGCSLASSSGLRDIDSGSDKSSTATPPTHFSNVSTPGSGKVASNGLWTITRPSTIRQKSHKGYMGIRVESVHYTGFFSSYEEAMQQILVDQVRQAQSKIRQVVQKAMIHCRRDALWELLETKPCTMTCGEFVELLSLVVVRPLKEIDPNLSPFLHMSCAWFTGLARLVVGRYQEEHRAFCFPQDGSQKQYVVVLNSHFPKTCFAFLLIDHVTPSVDIAIGYKEPIDEADFRAKQPSEKVLSIMRHIEEFVDLCCFHLWSGLVTK